jgi:hypothetical protein
MKLTGKTLEGNYIGAIKTSGALIDRPTNTKMEVEIGGESYSRTVYRRAIWRNQRPSLTMNLFVRVNGKAYEVA